MTVPKPTQAAHQPVLLEAVLRYLNPQAGETYFDLTAGYGGHAGAVLKGTKNPHGSVLVDRDQAAITVLQTAFGQAGVKIIHSDFESASQKLVAAGKQFDLILADLGVSSPHLNTASRGFSIRLEGPLDMRMDQGSDLTSDTIVNDYKETDLARIIAKYGEEPRARQIAHNIVTNRPVRSTTELATIVAQVAGWRGAHRRLHPATRTFQALRIAVNQELELLQRSLPLWFDLLSSKGRIVVISFHSLEDRLVKQAFAERSGGGYDASLRILTKHPVVPDSSELVFNPRARSAKLRAAAKINT